MKEDENKKCSIDLSDIPSPEKIIAENLEKDDFESKIVSINEFPPYVDESQNPNILIKGRWLERGGSAWWISTAGTGKSIASVQIAYKWGAGLDFAGLQPHRPIRSWIIQSEDSPSRVTIDREDVSAELSEKYVDVDWKAIAEENVKFVKISGKVGVEFLYEIEHLLNLAKKFDEMPDVLIINPFMAFVGGPVTDGCYVTPFLRGGDIGNKHTDGMQTILEKHNVSALIFHHTPKPPNEKEISAWLKSMYPEYQGAGSSDITNWGRSFITMMKVPGHSRVVCMCAGKNGSEIGWEEINGSKRKYMAWSDGESVSGGGRHAWRDLTQIEYDEIVTKEKASSEEEIQKASEIIASELKITACKFVEIEKMFTDMPRRLLRPAVAMVKANPSKYRLMKKEFLIGRQWVNFIGQAEGIANAVKIARQKAGVDEMQRKEKINGEEVTMPF